MTNNKTYLIEFTIVHLNGSQTPKKCRMKNCSNGVHAQVKLETHLKKTVADFKQLIVTKTPEEDLGDIFNGIFGNSNNFTNFSDIFKDLRNEKIFT